MTTKEIKNRINMEDICQVGTAGVEPVYQDSVQSLIDNTPSTLREEYSDGYHTFKELYEFRKVYNAALFNEWAKCNTLAQEVEEDLYGAFTPKYDVHKSWKHYDGKPCFGGDWFVVVAMLPTGQISNHYRKEDWDLFQIPEVERAKYKFDGHTPQDVLERLKELYNEQEK